MKLFQIEYMIATCKHGSISKAADELLVSRPAVSRALKELEDEFKVEFFLRTTTGISLTEAGMDFYESCVKIQEQIKQMENRMAAIRQCELANSRRRLRVGLSPATGHSIIPRYYDKFISAFPDILVEPIELLATQSGVMLRENTLDISIAAHFDEPEPGLAYADVSEMEFVFCCNKNNPIASKKTVTVPEIKDFPLVQLNKALMKGRVLASIYAKYGCEPNVKFRTQQVSMLWHFIKYSNCATIQFREMIDNNDDIVVIPFEEPITYPMRIMWNPNAMHNTAFNDFFIFVNRILREAGRPQIHPDVLKTTK